MPELPFLPAGVSDPARAAARRAREVLRGRPPPPHTPAPLRRPRQQDGADSGAAARQFG